MKTPSVDGILVFRSFAMVKHRIFIPGEEGGGGGRERNNDAKYFHAEHALEGLEGACSLGEV